jgi:hypothetical protein
VQEISAAKASAASAGKDGHRLVDALRKEFDQHRKAGAKR